MATSSNSSTTHITPERVSALLASLRAGTVPPKSPELAALVGIVETWAYLTERAQRFDLSLGEIRRVLGVLGRPAKRAARRPRGGAGDSTPADKAAPPSPASGQDDPTASEGGISSAEGASASRNDGSTERSNAAESIGGHGRRGETDFDALPVVRHSHHELSAGCLCPACERGRVYRFFTRAFYSISGQAPFEGRRHEIERLQCNTCGEIYDAPLPSALQADGVGNGRLYTYSAHSAVVLLKYLGVVPWQRQQTVQGAMGVHVPDACMWDMCRLVGDIVAPVAKVLEEIAAAAPVLYGDDTSARVLGLDSAVKPVRSTGKQALRTGCHTTAVIAETTARERVAVFRIGIQHTGEILDEILSARPPGLPKPAVMTDAASCNIVTACEVSACACNAHALRNFKELESDYPTELAPLLASYRAVFEHDAATKRMDADERLAYHRAHSRPLFRDMCQQALTQLEDNKVEPNSKLGAALDYLLNHQRRLSAFYRLPGAPLSNNLTERELRLAVRLRDAAPFFRSQAGAQVAAGLWTVLVTAMMHGTNAFDYFNAVQLHADDVLQNPGAWLPYNYAPRLAAQNRIPRPTPKIDHAAARRRAEEAAANDC